MTIRHSLAAIFTGAAFTASGQLTQAEEPREINLPVSENQVRVVDPEGAVRISYKDLDLLRILKRSPVVASAPDCFPNWLAILDGQRVRLRGYMRPGPQSKDLPFFVLSRDTTNTAFGPIPAPYDFIPVVLRNGVTTDYIHLRPFDVVGVFHLEMETSPDDEEELWFVYHIDDGLVFEG